MSLGNADSCLIVNSYAEALRGWPARLDPDRHTEHAQKVTIHNVTSGDSRPGHLLFTDRALAR
jgi:hypothetical protein